MGIRRSIREYAGLPPKKFTQALSYAISKTSSQPKVGKTLLYKIMYFADFDFYELNEILLTGEKYRSITHGPAPVHFDKAIAALKASGEIREARVGNGPYVQVKYESLKDPDVPELSDEEKAHMDKVVQRLSRMTATGVSA
ncbi:MAG: Panacea domain-containing protein, partial [Candidatus Thermoplasmatota archaeon]|nr:Panacea domain-containing protein [Candidatus Thermoplasmatota archaeon]